MPRDSWLLDRRHVQPRQEFFAARMGAVALQTDLILQAQSVDHLLSLLNAHGQLLRIDETVTPKRYRCATVSQAELAELRRIKHIVRLGHVRRIDTDRIVLDRGSIPTDARTVHVDCTSSGIGARTSTPVFEGRTITLQSVRTCQQGFSAALIAHIELGHTSEAEKNRLCNPIPLPELDIDWLTMFVANLENQRQWTNNADLRGWIAKSRLDINFGQSREPTGEERELVQRFKDNAAPAVAKLRLLLGSQDRDSGFEAAATRRGTTPHVASTAEHVG
jgi:hypothetical protein